MNNYFPVKRIIKIVDGDTVDVLVDLGFYQYHQCRVRLDGIDCPETRTRDPEEKEKGLAAKKRTKEWLKLHKEDLVLWSFGIGKYGRVLGDFLAGEAGLDVKYGLVQTLLDEGHGTPYDGGKR